MAIAYFSFFRVFLVAATLLLVASLGVFAQEVRRTYDAAGRLISVTDEQGRTITLDYDALGNLLGVRRVDTVGQVAINLVNPNSGFVGTQVDIIGKGFSNVPNQNAVAFNGVSAPVLAATTTTLTTQVPIGATTGPITVKTPSGSATSPQAFTVLVATINVSPSQATLVRGTSQQFTATITGPSDTRVAWSVDNIVGGNATVGTITEDGLYTAPPPSQSAIAPVVVAIKAASLAVPGLSATASVTILPSCTILWTGAGGNNLWQNAANWSTKVLPGANDDACIDAGFNVTLSSGNQSIRSFNSNSSLTFTAGVLNIAASSTLNHNFTLAGGLLSGTGTLTVSGQATWTSGTMSGTGTTIFNGNATITANGNIQNLDSGRKLNTAGTTTFSGANGEFRTRFSETINNSGVWIDETTGTTRIGNVFGSVREQGTFNNTGTFRKTGSATTTIISVFNNTSSGAGTGVVDLQSTTLNFSGDGGTANSGSSFTGVIGTTLGFGGGTYNLQSGSNVNAATFALNSGGVNVGGSYSATATSINSGTANFIPGAVVSTMGALTFFTGRANFNTGALVPITTLTLNGGELSGADAVTVSGQATWNGGTMSGSGTTTFSGNATITANGNIQNLVGGRTLNIAGTLTHVGADGGFRAGSGGATINIFGMWLDQTTGTTGIGNPFGGSFEQATIRNTGTFRKTGSATTNVASVFNNVSPGVVDVQAGTLNLSNGGTQSGDFVTAAGATLRFNGGTFNINTLSISSLRVSTTVNVLGTLTVGGLLENLTSGNLNVTGQVNANSYSHNGGTLSGTGNLTVSGQATWTSGTMTGSGTTIFNGNATITANGNIQFIGGGRKFNTAGTTMFTGADGEFRTGSSETINNSGVWIDQTTGTTRIGNVFGGIFDQGTFNNTGTFRKTGSATTAIISVFNNSGTVDIQSGSLSFSSGYTQTAGETKLNGGSMSSSTTVSLQGGELFGVGTLTGNVNNAALVSPGTSPGILNISGNYTQTAAGALNIEIGGLTAGTQFDRLAISGSATLNGTLNISLINGFTPSPGDSFQIMTFGSRSGTFTTINGLDLGGGRAFQVNLTATSLTLVTPP